MKKWEYLRLVVSFSSQLQGKVEYIYSNGVKIFDDRKNPMNIYDYLNQLGQDGWELIDAGDGTFYLKRPLEELSAG